MRKKLKSKLSLKFAYKGEVVEATVGRVLLSEILPKNIPFAFVNRLMTKKEMTKLIDAVYRQAGLHEVAVMLDRLKDLGFTYATKAGVSICIDNMHIPTKKEELISRAQTGVQ